MAARLRTICAPLERQDVRFLDVHDAIIRSLHVVAAIRRFYDEDPSLQSRQWILPDGTVRPPVV